LVNGIGAFTAVLKTARSQSITAAHSSVTAGTSNVTVIAGAATQFVFTEAPAGGDLNYGENFDLVLQAQDAYGNVDTTYNSTITVSTDGDHVNLDGYYNSITVNMVSGVMTATGQAFFSAGEQMITVTAADGTFSASFMVTIEGDY
jgi:hypothetical protein